MLSSSKCFTERSTKTGSSQLLALKILLHSVKNDAFVGGSIPDTRKMISAYFNLDLLRTETKAGTQQRCTPYLSCRKLVKQEGARQYSFSNFCYLNLSEIFLGHVFVYFPFLELLV